MPDILYVSDIKTVRKNGRLVKGRIEVRKINNTGLQKHHPYKLFLVIPGPGSLYEETLYDFDSVKSAEVGFDRYNQLLRHGKYDELIRKRGCHNSKYKLREY